MSSHISQPRAVLYFSHDKALLKVLTALKFFQPNDDLRHDNFETMSNSTFRTSYIASFANNIGFVLYK